MTHDERRLLRDHLRGWADHLDVQDITCVCGHLQGRHLTTNHQLGNLVQCFDCWCQRFRPKGGQ